MKAGISLDLFTTFIFQCLSKSEQSIYLLNERMNEQMTWESLKLILNENDNQIIIQLTKVHYTKIYMGGGFLYQLQSDPHSHQATGNIWTVSLLLSPRCCSSVACASLHWNNPFVAPGSVLQTGMYFKQECQASCLQLYHVQGSKIQSHHLDFCRPSSLFS